jgi:sugar/nucleoside kinase (ribokinase family)
MVPDPGANISLLEHHVPVDEFRAGDHLHVSGYALLRDSRDAAVHALAAATAAGMTVSVGAASSAPLAQLGAETFLTMLPEYVLLFANEREAGVLTGRHGADADDLARHLAAPAREVVVTAGSGMAAWSDGATVETMAAEPLDRPELDTTGAGDAFAAGFLAARARGAVPSVCLRDGHALAAAACRTTGGRPEPR